VNVLHLKHQLEKYSEGRKIRFTTNPPPLPIQEALIMTTHVHSHDGLTRIADGIDAISSIGAGARQSLVSRLVKPLGSILRAAFARLAANREAMAIAEIERYDWRLAAEIRAAAQRDNASR
jgi:hypothetical protein